MNRIISLVLALVMCLSLCACGNSNVPHPLSAEFQSEEELLVAFNAYFSEENWSGISNEQRNEMVSEFVSVLKNNSSIHHYFQKGDEAVALAYKLGENPVLSNNYQETLWLVFEACNETNWYAGIVSNEDSKFHSPFFKRAWRGIAPTKSSVAKAIQDEFRDPLSVSILEGSWVFLPPKDGYYELPFKFLGLVTVRYANVFGGYETTDCTISGTLGGEIEIVSNPLGLRRDILYLYEESEYGALNVMK